jgi:hypothetical protein
VQEGGGNAALFSKYLRFIRTNAWEPRRSEVREGRLNFAKLNKPSRSSLLRGKKPWLRLEDTRWKDYE